MILKNFRGKTKPEFDGYCRTNEILNGRVKGVIQQWFPVAIQYNCSSTFYKHDKGIKKGHLDEERNLLPEFIRIMNEGDLKFLIENVAH